MLQRLLSIDAASGFQSQTTANEEMSCSLRYILIVVESARPGGKKTL